MGTNKANLRLAPPAVLYKKQGRKRYYFRQFQSGSHCLFVFPPIDLTNYKGYSLEIGMSCDSSHPQSSVEHTQEVPDNEEPENNNNNDVADFKYYNSTDQIYWEYDPPRRQCVSAASWKEGRPTYLKSWLRCILSSFIFTVLCGAGIAVVAILFVWLKISLGAICRIFIVDGTWYKLPEGIQKALLTEEVIECMLIECWYMSVNYSSDNWLETGKEIEHSAMEHVCSINRCNLSATLNVYRAYNTSWSSYPLNILFARSILFISYKVSSNYRQFRDCSFEISEGGQTIWGEGHKIYYIILFVGGGLKFITPVLGGYEFSNLKLVGFVLPNILHYNSSKSPLYFLLLEVIIIFQGFMLDRSSS